MGCRGDVLGVPATSDMVPPSASALWWWPQAAYVHVPFCAHHCGYCDFAVTAGQDHLMALYVEALGEELARLQQPQPMQTIFIGGGTPTYLPVPLLRQLLEQLNHWLPLAHGGEFSIEATPESISPEKVALLADFGINRVSLGVQTFQPHLLPRLDRRHTTTDIGTALDLIRHRIAAMSLDLIFGIPGQSLDEWQADLEAATALGITHLSTYGLTYEKGTPLWKQRERGELLAQPEEMELAFYERAMDVLRGHGFEHYEVSNFAQPGAACRHNETYWANHAYFGFGVGAARYVQGRRELNRRQTADYIRVVLAGEDPTFQREELPSHERARETAAIQLRRSRGMEWDAFYAQTGFALDDILTPGWRTYSDEGLLEADATGVRLTRRGRCVADGLVMKLFWA